MWLAYGERHFNVLVRSLALQSHRLRQNSQRLPHRSLSRLPTILGDSRIDSLNTSQTPVQSCPEVSAGVRENEFTSLPQLHDGKPLVDSSVPRSPALSKNEKWCAIQGSNLKLSPATAGIERMDSPIDSPQLSLDSELVEISTAWAKLPDALRAGILAIIRSANPDPSIAR
jgi:hypothetical protein